MKRHRELPDQHDAWRDQEVLEDLFVTRGWTADDIVDHFRDLGSESISNGRVRYLLNHHDIRCEQSSVPNAGASAALWRMDKDAIGQGGDA